MARYVCIHGHFYQPPRENPWLEAIELQDSAYPYHDWNERISAECYNQNAHSRILGSGGMIEKIINNYARISFNVGPTLLSWMEAAAPDTYRAILRADELSMERFDGHGSAMAQVYNHMILPLANERDRDTQVIWGLRDFKYRFGREPEGMWLAETAADVPSLEALAGHGIKFTVLAPGQARRVRPMTAKKGQSATEWKDVSGGRVDPMQPYRVMLPSGRHIDVFFYDGPVSQAVAFEKLLASGERFANRILGLFGDDDEDRLAHIATDGETYGHHHRFGDMALAYALDQIEHHDLDGVKLINYAAYLEKHPPTMFAEIVEPSSWSCAHGVERWRSDCGCHTGGKPEWNQKWRAPLREALDWLRDSLASTYTTQAKWLLNDGWSARNDYIDVILDRSEGSVDRFLSEHAVRELNDEERTRALKLLEMQRHAQLMYTSCGWFFNELSGIETVQVMQYAGRAIQLAQDLSGEPIEEEFLKRLEKAKSNIAEHRDGRHIYETMVRPAMVDLPKVAAHYAASSLFEEYGTRTRIHAFDLEQIEHRNLDSGAGRVALGQVQVTSVITQESSVESFGVLHFGDHNLSGGVGQLSTESFDQLVGTVSDAFDAADLPEVLRLLDESFGELSYSMRTLFRDEQRRALDTILEETLQDTEEVSRRLYERHGPLIRFLASVGHPIPQPVRMAAQFVLNGQLREASTADPLDVDRVEALLAEARRASVDLDLAGVGFALQGALRRLAEPWLEHPQDLALLQALETTVARVVPLPFPIDLSKLQNQIYAVKQSRLEDMQKRADEGDERAGIWVTRFRSLGTALKVRV